MAVLTAAALRLWQLGHIPPGLYRDEAANGLDALGVLAGQHSLYFAENNGREPSYIYLTALAVAILGRSALAVRISAAIAGTLTTLVTFKLAETWFGWRVGLLSAWMWAITLWPIHLSRIGLRPILLPPILALAFWLGTVAYRRTGADHTQRPLWLLAGLCYGLSYYTYLPARFTPLLLSALGLYLVWTGRLRRLWPSIGWFGLGTAAVVMPLIILGWKEPDLVFGRSTQVSILDFDGTDGALLGTLWRQTWRSLGMFFLRGDTIVRHNPMGRPVFDAVMAVPFVIGLAWCLRHWRRPSATFLVLWSALMLVVTILAVDAPHFLRAAGVLPAAVIFPALGLSQLGTWTKLPSRSRRALLILLPSLSLALTVKDYFLNYGRQPTTAYWFEAAARDLAENINNEPTSSTLFVDRRFLEGWSSVRFLLRPELPATFYRPSAGPLDGIMAPAVIYAWPHESLDRVLDALSPPALTTGLTGSLAQGDLEKEPYPLYVRYSLSTPTDWPILANFDDKIQLRQAEVRETGQQGLQVDLYWSTKIELDRSFVTFVHVVDGQNLVGQDDSIPSQGNWPTFWWRPGLTVIDTHVFELQEAYDVNRHDIVVGWYDSVTRLHLPLVGPQGAPIDETWLLRP